MKEILIGILIALLSGGVGAAVVKLIGDSFAFRRERKAKKEDTEALGFKERLDRIESQNDAQKLLLDNQREALKYLLYDRIRFLGQAYIKDGCIDFDDRRILNDMHRSYHTGLDGNGDLNNLMEEVNKLPLKMH